MDEYNGKEFTRGRLALGLRRKKIHVHVECDEGWSRDELRGRGKAGKLKEKREIGGNFERTKGCAGVPYANILQHSHRTLDTKTP